MIKTNDITTDLHLFEQQMLSGATAPPSAREQSVVSIVFDRLSGRWKWMIVVGIVLGSIAAWLGYTSTVPMYRSLGMVRVNPQVMPILEPIPEIQIQYLRQFVNTQTQLLESNNVIDKAIGGEHIQALERSQRPSRAEVQRDLEIESERDGLLIFVGYRSPDANVSEAVVNGILDSYDELYARTHQHRAVDTLEKLELTRDRLLRERAATDTSISQLRQKNSALDLEHELQTTIDQINQVDANIFTAETQLTRLSAAPGGTDGDPIANEPSAVLLELIHPPLAEARLIRDQAQTNFLIQRRDFGENSMVYKQARKDLDAANLAYDEEYTRAVARWEQDGPEILQADDSYEGLTPAQITAEIEQMNVAREGLASRRDSLLQDIQELETLQQTQERLTRELNEVQERYEDLQREQPGVAEQITIAQRASKETHAYSDSRLKRALAGLVAGCMASFGLFFLIGTFDRRAFEARQLHYEIESPRCLGVLPDLGETVADPDTRDMASHCIHQIRNQIEAVRPPNEGYVLAVSSPFQGDGKTSIVMALGWSYAAAGFRTLLIDCDLVGRSLTRQVGMLGQPGLKEALITGHMNGELTQLPVKNLTVLPVGSDNRFGPESLRRIDLDRLFAEVRDLYDMVLVDTGPVLGSLESIPVSAAADSVVLSVRRGRSRTRLQECIARLHSTGSSCLGVILNWAGRSDCQRYVSEASLAATEALRHSNVVGGRGSRRDTGGDQNALILAMESTSRRADSKDEMKS